MKCETRSGTYQCKHERGHAGDCEADDDTSFRFGPYHNAMQGLAYLRGQLDARAGEGLDLLGLALGMRRSGAEVDRAYRERLWQSSGGR